eukprot:TRINITY_DN15365_c0_g2_i1.p1 TRINITY_DN15365_c0_g2~~TRINITY_DN15365_c0_g2_i1.p1  ORF type:complete len:419 (+),score=104.39 TRINITY_DN15365_c0_g2_i1:142-1398(+)
MPGSQGGSNQSRMAVVSAGVAHAVLIWWELEVGEDVWYSSAATADGWQDHWQQALCVLPPESQIELSPGNEIDLVASHNDEQVQFCLAKANKKPRREAALAPESKPGLMVPATRIRQLHDPSYLSVLRAGCEHALATKGVGASCLDISDGAIGALVARAAGAKSVSTLETGDAQMLQFVGDLCSANSVTDASEFRVLNLPANELTVNLLLNGPAQIVASEPFWDRLSPWHIHEALNFQYTAMQLLKRGIIAENAIMVPSSARIMARAVQFRDCSRAYTPPATVCGLDHSMFRNVASVHLHDLNLPVWQYSHLPLSDDFEICKLEFGKDMVAPAESSALLVKPGRCDALVLWVDYDVCHSNTDLPQSFSTDTPSHHQYVRLLEKPREVSCEQAGKAAIRCTMRLGTQPDLEDYTLEIIV